jgi:uncharacterized peroxidase-related enzyme
MATLTEAMYLPAVENNPDAQGAYSEVIRIARSTGAHLPQIWHLFAFKPEATKHLERFTHEVMRGPSPLSPGLRELIATYTSGRNECPFCRKAHAAVAADLLGSREKVEAALSDANSPLLTREEAALLRFVGKVTRAPWDIGPSDIEALHEAGWGDDAIYDAVTVCAMFNFYNRWILGTGVHPMSDEAHQAAVARMAKGYIRTPESL